MDKKQSAVAAKFIVALVGLGMAVFYFLGPEDKNPNAITDFQMPASQITSTAAYGAPYTPEKDLIAGICALMLVGYLFWACYRWFQKDSLAEEAAKENTLYKISLETGRNEYDLFHKCAADWSIPADKIEHDFKRYMTDQVMPHYVKDFVRKNQAHLDESLVQKKDVTPTTWSDWAKALLVFPGSVLLILFIFFSMG